MKPVGTTLEFTRQRNNALLAAYRQCIKEAPGLIHPRDIIARAVLLPAPRFWVSEERAFDVISRRLAGKPFPPTMRYTARLMFAEILRRAQRLHATYPRLHLRDIISQVIHSPAPQFYLTPDSALNIIYKIRNGYYDRRLDKSRNR